MHDEGVPVIICWVVEVHDFCRPLFLSLHVRCAVRSPSARFRSLLLHLASVVLVMLACITIGILWEMRDLVVNSLWFGIVGFRFPNYAFLRGFSVTISFRIGYN